MIVCRAMPSGQATGVRAPEVPRLPGRTTSLTFVATVRGLSGGSVRFADIIVVAAMASGLLLGSQGGSLAAPTAYAAELVAVSVARHSAYEPADSAGVPLKPCGPANDGERVETLDANGAKGIFF